jgi:hypothetical protein
MTQCNCKVTPEGVITCVRCEVDKYEKQAEAAELPSFSRTFVVNVSGGASRKAKPKKPPGDAGAN